MNIVGSCESNFPTIWNNLKRNACPSFHIEQHQSNGKVCVYLLILQGSYSTIHSRMQSHQGLAQSQGGENELVQATILCFTSTESALTTKITILSNLIICQQSKEERKLLKCPPFFECRIVCVICVFEFKVCSLETAYSWVIVPVSAF